MPPATRPAPTVLVRRAAAVCRAGLAVFVRRAAAVCRAGLAVFVGRRAARIGGPAPAGFVGRAVAVGVVSVAILAVTSPPAEAWRRPVPGAVARPFAYSPAEPFVRDRHRGADLRARPGATVRAACTGRVAFAGRAVVTLRCGPWRVTHLPLATFAVHAGERVREGTPLGTLAPSRDHRGLHLGVRRAGDRFAYVDPLRFLPEAGGPPATLAPPGEGVPRAGPAGDSRPAPAEGPRPVPGGDPRAPRPAPGGDPRPVPGGAPRGVLAGDPRAPRPAHAGERRSPMPDGVRVPSGRPPAPWPVWIGLALALLGAAGHGVRVRARKRRALPEPVASAS